MQHVQQRGAYRVLVGIPEGTRPLGIPCHRYKNNINCPSRNQGVGVDQTDLVQDRDSSCEPSDKPSGSIKCEEFIV